MKRLRIATAAFIGGVILAWSTAPADEPFVGSIGRPPTTGHHAPYRNKHWPALFQPTDRDSVRAAFRAVEDQGWLRAHTLGDHLFDAESQSLTDAGKGRVRAIASHAPSTRRMVFVSATANEAITQARVDSVRQFVGLIPVRAGQLQVTTVDLDPLETPALSADDANRQTRLPPVHNLSPQPLFFGYGAGGAGRE